jgi:soluble lytic murein transglycosylase
LPTGCDAAVGRLLGSGRLSQLDVLVRYEQALQADRLAVARTTAELLEGEAALPDGLFAQQAADPARWLERLDSHPRLRAARLLELFTLRAIAREDLPRARGIWERVAVNLPLADRTAGWVRIGVQATQRLDPGALDDFRRARGAVLQDSDLSWAVRAALRAGAWDDVLRATDQMSEAEAAKPAWRYWRARALRAAGRREEASALFAQVGHETDFYGQLAADELGRRVLIGGAGRADAEAQAAIRQRPGIQRAIALYRLGLQAEAVREWNYVLEGLGERQFLAAAEVARQADWFERMISAAEHAGIQSDVTLRYPLPFREALQGQAHAQALDEAWLYGLVRQESRFLPGARSRTGATGLMQLMPATARWVARKMGLRDYKQARFEEVQTNLQLGSFYLRHVLDDLGHPVLATAAYNAGPNRVRRWLEAHAVEGAVFCETIPVAETRDYVQRVFANANLYAQRLGQPPHSLKDRLGQIKGLAGLPSVDPADPDGNVDLPLPPIPVRLPAPPPAPALANGATSEPDTPAEYLPAEP